MKTPLNNRGFTLVEILAVMIILGIMVAIAVPKYISINKNAEKAGIDMAVIDLNGREMKCWTEAKLNDGWSSDQKIFESCDYEIKNYKWVSLYVSGGQLNFQETSVILNRRQSARHEPANWTVD